MGNTTQKSVNNNQNLNKNGGLSKKQPTENKVALSYPNYVYQAQDVPQVQDNWSHFNQPPFYYSPQELMSQQPKVNSYFYPYDNMTQNQYYPSTTPSVSTYGGYYSKSPAEMQQVSHDTGSKYTIKGSKKQSVRDSSKTVTESSPLPYYSKPYQNMPSYYQSYYPYGQNYFNYYPNNFYSYYGGINGSYYQPYSQVYMNFGQSPYGTVDSPKIKVKDYIIPLPVEEQQPTSSSVHYRGKSKKIKSPTEFERHNSLNSLK